MDTDTKTKTPSLRSTTSSLTLKQDDEPQSQAATSDSQCATPARYVYYKQTGAPNPDAKPKEKSKVSKFLTKFQSPAVKATNEAREREKLEEERTGRKIYTPTGVPQGASAWMAESHARTWMG